MDKLEALFHKEMLSLHEKWRSECSYTATVFIKIVKQHGGVKAAQILLRGQGLSRGFLKLMTLQRLDLSMENLVIQPKWATLFTEAEREIAKNRLEEAGSLKSSGSTMDTFRPKKQKPITGNIGSCPKCNSAMVLRTSRAGKKFYGCSNYPRCNGTKSYLQ